MMVNCPKCGFSQPEDQYCAKCGVDMHAFVPARVPFLRRTLRHPGFQVGTLAIIAISGFLFIRKQHEDALSARIAAVREAREVEEMDRGLADSNPSNASNAAATNRNNSRVAQVNSANSQTADSRNANAANSNASANNIVVTAQPNSATASAAAKNAASSAPIPTSATVSFYEANRGFLNQLLNSSGNMVSTGTVAYAVLPNIGAKMRNGSGVMTKVDEGFQNLAMNQPVLFFKGGREPASGAGLGFAVQLQALTHDENGTTFQMSILRSLRDPGSGMADDTEIPISENVVIPAGGALVVAGLLPHMHLSNADEKLYKSISVLRMMTTDNFKAGISEAAMIIEPK